ncbi:MAG TPA: 3-deoxy-8-phosphooctulonate synthase [Planctomycetota bacterium]|jgi:2-dehydro-3-deoxyphosphooctonate aldolase (KDO 8-P synthase)|nr:3-deoxy-8-phosphooctulonate synthase [Planctomycetota bacterium]HJM39883.1 3-deoxy-8-phosphooctulonate synthase [Planctomycetota bacterium]|tara:strand:- start:201 stop:1004 length:804 start_codon:yes stop_codon:yes gene_type:complete
MSFSETTFAEGISLGEGRNPLLIAGPCVIQGAETIEHAHQTAEALSGLPIQWVFKASFDKANRTSGSGKRGVGLQEGLSILAQIKEALGVPILTDVHLPEQCAPAAEICDILQIPAFLCRQTDLLLAAGKTKRAVNIKKGQFLAPRDCSHAAEKVRGTGNEKVLLTERGTFFGYGRLVVDFASLPDMQAHGCPVLLDATHSVQAPGGLDGATGGDWKRAPILLRAGAAAGYDGFFIETHPNPKESPSDAENMIPLQHLREILEECLS